MSRRGSSLSNVSTSGISRDIGSKYDNVKKVAGSIAAVVTVSDNLDVISSVSNIRDAIVALDSINGKLVSLATDKATLDSLYADKLILDSLYADKLILDSLYADKAVLDSLYADKIVLDSLYADKATLDSLFNDKSTLDSLYTDKEVLDSLYNAKATIDRLFGSIDNIDRLGVSIDNIDTVAVAISDVDTVATNVTDVNTVSNNVTDVNTVAASIGSINTVADIQNLADIITVADDLNSMDLNGVADVTVVANDLTGANSITTVSANIVDVSVVANNITDVNSFADTYYGTLSTAPTTTSHPSLTQGDLYYDSVLNELRTFDGEVWKSAGSTVNGTSRRQVFTATTEQTTFAITGGYDAGFADVYLNGRKLENGVDVDTSSGADIVLAVGASAGDIVDVVTYGAFVLADHYTKSEDDKLLDTKAGLNGSATQTFKVSPAVNDDEALSKGQLLTAIKEVDGSGSGIDADKLDGLEASNFANMQGDNTQTFKVAPAVNDDEAVSKSQMETSDALKLSAKYGTNYESILKNDGTFIKNQCTAWIMFKGDGNILDSYNIASVTRDDTGTYTIEFETEMDNSDYAFISTCSYHGSDWNDTGTVQQNYTQESTTTYFECFTYRLTHTEEKQDFHRVSIAFFGGKE